ncbi:MAG: class I SAM-dependent methyltransferase, partial [Pseudomonadota bacterium]
MPQRLRFRLFGLEKTQRQLIQGIKQAGLDGAELLEIGCGPGYLHQALLQSGAAHATGVDLAEGMLAEARTSA